MGNNQSNISEDNKKIINDEFIRVKKHDNYIVLDDIYELNIPKIYDIEITNIAIVYLFDRNLQGYLTLDDLYEGFDTYASYYNNSNRIDSFENSFTSLCLCNFSCGIKSNTENTIAEWIMSLLKHSNIYEKTNSFSKDVIQLLYKFLDIYETSGVSYDEFDNIISNFLSKKKLETANDNIVLLLCKQYISGFYSLINSINDIN